MIDKVSEVVSPVYLVGGAVRDLYMGLTPKDYDFATPLTPDEVEAAVRAAGKRPYLVGKRFGTVGFKVDGEMVEVTTFRGEKYVEGSRKPEVEYLTDINQDLARRDFTINAMARSNSGKFIDPFDGEDDIVEKLIRAVGTPAHRFKEDPLRMLRACRFAAQFGFFIDEDTFKSMTKLSHRILFVSKERWCMELDKLLMSDYPVMGLSYLWDSGLMKFMIPELQIQSGYDQRSRFHNLPLSEHTLAVVDKVPKDINLRWAALLHDVGKPFAKTDKGDRCIYVKHDMIGAEIVNHIAHYLKWSNDRTKTVHDLVLNHLLEESPLKEADDLAK